MFETIRYCKKCGKEIAEEGEVYTLTSDKEFCECKDETTNKN